MRPLLDQPGLNIVGWIEWTINKSRGRMRDTRIVCALRGDVKILFLWPLAFHKETLSISDGNPAPLAVGANGFCDLSHKFHKHVHHHFHAGFCHLLVENFDDSAYIERSIETAS